MEGLLSRLAPNQLTARKVKTLKDGVYSDGGNLWVSVDGRTRTWSVRYTSPVTGKRREMGLGPVRDLPLAKAREQAAEARRLIREGVDPIDARKQAKADRTRQNILTFKAAAERFLVDRRAGWSDPRAVSIWTSSLARLAYPAIGSRPVDLVNTENVLGVLRPIWTTTTETADRVRGRIERILDYATTHGWRKGENPARWRGHLSNILPHRTEVAAVKHHAALHWSDIGCAMRILARAEGIGALAVRFACLTAARSGEVRGAVWGEVDFKAKIWAIPAERMKAKREHRVPLSAPALAVLETARELSDGAGLVFAGGRLGRPLSDVALSKALHRAAGTQAVTVHGLRSTFRDWTAEQTDFPRDVAEMALAHAIGDKVEAAYRRGDLFDKRRDLMEAWGRFAA